MTYTLHTKYRKILADTLTPVSVYLRLRDYYPNTLLLESSDYHTSENSFSYICFNPIATFKCTDGVLTQNFPDGKTSTQQLKKPTATNQSQDLVTQLQAFTKAFKVKSNASLPFTHSGIFGYTAFDSVSFFETLPSNKQQDTLAIPQVYYAVYQNIIAINHFKNEAFIFSHNYNTAHNLEQIAQRIKTKPFAVYPFQKKGAETSNLTDAQFINLVNTCKAHCQRGDVFQIVPSKQFQQDFEGDEFNVYRALRNVNPSPYLFYFDYGNFKIFGSSPEAQLKIINRKAEIHPIAGTFKRSGNDEKDAELAKALAANTKENSEHVMLVDLARNDLSKLCNQVTVDTYKEVQFFSHVIHLVSKVVGQLKPEVNPWELVAHTFPAGTLSGAPKHKALSLLGSYEPTARSFYGGAIGFMDFDGNYNHAILIRSFVSKNHTLYYQAGAGVVSESNPEKELQEVYNKIGALTKALELAQQITP